MYQFYKGTLHQQLNLDRADFLRFEQYVAVRLQETPTIKLEQQPGLLRFTMPWFGNRWSRTSGNAMMWLSSGQFEFQADRTVTYTFHVHRLFLIFLGFFLVVSLFAISQSDNFFFAIPVVLWIALIFGINTWVIYKAQKRMFDHLETHFLAMKRVFLTTV